MTPSEQKRTSKEIPLEELQPGMRLSETIKDTSADEQLLEAGKTLNEQDIKALKKRDVLGVRVTKKSYERKKSANQSNSGVVDFSQDELEGLVDDVIQDHENERQKQKEELEDTYDDAINFVDSLFDKVDRNRPFEVDQLEKLVDELKRILTIDTEETLKLTRIRHDEKYLLSNTVNVTILGLHLGREIGFEKHELMELGIGCLLHDIGLTKIPDKLLRKNGAFTDKEAEVFRKHPIFKKEYLENIDGLSYLARSVVYQHHERMDGSGYPKGIENNEISKIARTVAVADAYEAMVNPRIYGDRRTSYEAMQSIIQKAGTKFWEKAARYFYQSMTIYPIGSVVRLDDNSVGVVHQATGAPMRPKIKLLVDEEGNKLEKTRVINLLEDKSYFIDEVLDEVDL